MNKVMRSLVCSLKVVPASCGALATVHGTNQWLTELEFSETKLEAFRFLSKKKKTKTSEY